MLRSKGVGLAGPCMGHVKIVHESTCYAGEGVGLAGPCIGHMKIVFNLDAMQAKGLAWPDPAWDI